MRITAGCSTTLNRPSHPHNMRYAKLSLNNFGNKRILAKYDQLKHDYFDKQIVQLTLDYFLEGSTTSLTAFPDISNCQYKESPALSPNCSTIHLGTVARNDEDVVVALDNTVFVPLVNKSPNKGINKQVYKVTYPVTIRFIYPYPHIGNRDIKHIGKRGINMTIQNPRQLRGLAILSSGLEAIKRVSDYEYKVKSQHGEHYYDVKNTKFGLTCTCPNWQQYQTACKHIYAVEFSMQLRLEVERDIDTDNILKASEIVVCPECESDKVIKFGRRKCKKGYNQRYECKSCGHTFVVNRELSRLKATPEVVSVVMDLYFKGISLAKIKQHIKMFHDTDVGRNTIMRWIHKFSTILSDYSEKHKPQVGDLWHSDEMTAKNRANGKGVRNHDWIWNLMDSDTRYLLASKITKTRTPTNARKPLREGKERAGKTPKALITDGQHSYNEAVKKEFGTRTDPTIHFRTRSNRKYFLNQNLERLNGSIRERLKVMRGFDHRETGQIILDGERFYYNNIRPHMSLKDMTPAQVSGLPYVPKDENAWLTYLKVALDEKRKTNRHGTRTTK